MTSNDPLQRNCSGIEDNHKMIVGDFDRYKHVPTESSFPNVDRMLEDPNCDIDSLLRPVVRGCRELLNEVEEKDEGNLLTYLTTIHAGIKLRVNEPPAADSTAKIDSHLDAWFYFHIARLRRFKDRRMDYESLYRWLRICYNVTDKSSTHFFVFYELSRDQEMRQAVFDEQNRLRPFFSEQAEPGRVYLPKLATWFIARYDLDAAFFILDHLAAKGVGVDKALKTKIWSDKGRRLFGPAFWFSALIFLFLLLAATTQIFFRRVPISGIETTVGEMLTPVINSPSVQTWVLLPYAMFTLIFILCILLWLWRSGFSGTRKLLPRLLGGMMVGYIPLMSSEDVWKWLLNLPSGAAFFIWMLGMLLSYLYLYLEARQTLSDGEVNRTIERDMRVRAAQVFCIGLVQSLLVGILLCEVIGYAALGGLARGNSLPDGEILYVLRGLLGTLVPKVVLLYAPLALFLGILVQLFWEEKTVTQPL